MSRKHPETKTRSAASPDLEAERRHRREAVRPVIQELKRLIRYSELSQRDVEQQAGFSKGYLSQVLGQNLDLKMHHVLIVLGVLDVPPARFFRQVFEPDASGAPASVRDFERRSEPLSQNLRAQLDTLYGGREEVLDRLDRRLKRCERALDHLEQRGILSFDRTDGSGESKASGERTDGESTDEPR